MACDNETARELSAALIAQVTPFYAVTVVALIALGMVAFDMYRGKYAAPSITRAIVAFTLVGLLGYGMWRVSYDRAYIRTLTDFTCAGAKAKQ